MIHTFGRLVCYLFSTFLFPIKVSGKKNIPAEGGFIVASNHVSYLDPIVVGVACPRKLNYMARHELFLNPLFGAILYKVNAFPVKRNSADIKAMKEAIQRVGKKGQGLLVFPEGRRGAPGLKLTPQAGVGFLVRKLGVPVIPAFVSGSEHALPKGAKFIRPSRVYVSFGKQVHFTEGMSPHEIAQHIMDDIRHLSC